MVDMAEEDPRLWKIIKMVEDYNSKVINKYLSIGAEYMGFGDDLGLQNSLPMSPEMWRKFIKPSFMRMFKPCRDADVPVFLHTDGHILEIIPARFGYELVINCGILFYVAITADTFNELNYKEGQEVWVTFNPSVVRFIPG